MPSSAWLNLNQARLLHQSLPAGDKDGLARPGPGEECCPAGTQPQRSIQPGLPVPPALPLLPQQVPADMRARGSWLGLETATCQGQWGWTELGALVLGQGRTLELQGCPAPLLQGGSHHPGTWGELARPQSPRLYVHTGYREMKSLCPKQQPFRGSQEKLPGGKSPSGSGPPRSHGAACAHAGRRCHRSGSGGERWGQAQGAAVFPQPRLPSKSNIVGTRQAPCAGSAYTGLS